MPELIDRVLMLARVDAFSQLTTEQLSLLALVARSDERAIDEVVYRAGEPALAMYLVLSGRIVLERDGVTIADIAAGEDFGTWALFDPEPRVTSARASEPTALLKIERQSFDELVEDHPGLAHGILRSLARRVRTLAGLIEGADDHRANREQWT